MRVRSAARAVALLGLAAAAACARPYPPPGGDRPETPPRILSTVPEPLAVVPGFRGAVVFGFDRRISEQMEANPVVVSPLTSPLRVNRGRQEIRVALEAGWAPGQIYRVVLLPGVRDRFGNRTTEPIEIVFSTGPEIPATAVAGLVLERVTGRAARNVMVEATRLADSVVYVTPADTAGFFSLRHLPEGEYEAVAYSDLNRNMRLDRSEPVAPPAAVRLDGPADTVPLLFSVLVPDTTPAVLTRADATDSVRVRLQFDDHLDPDSPLDAAAVQLLLLPDSTPGPPGTLLSAAQDAEQRRLAADTVASDTTAVQPAIVQPPIERAPSVPGLDTGPLPARELVFVADTPLLEGRQYMVRVAGIINVNGVSGGGGEAVFTVPERPASPEPDPPGGTPELRTR